MGGRERERKIDKKGEIAKEGGGMEKRGRTCKKCSEVLWKLYDILQFLREWFHRLHLDERILLRCHALSASSVVVHAWLFVQGREDGVSLAKFYLASLVEVLEVPANERVVVRVGISRDERSAPVNLQQTSM